MKYLVLWKGGSIGRFTRAQILEKAARRELGALHRVRLDDGLELPLGDFLKLSENERPAPRGGGAEEPGATFGAERPAGGFDFEAFSYLAAGFAFLSIWAFCTACAYALLLQMSGRGKSAAKCALMSAASCAAGQVVFRLLL